VTTHHTRPQVLAAAVSILVVTGGPAAAVAQSGLEAGIRQYNATAIKGYVQPLADVLVANLAGGYHNGAPPPESRFTVTLEFAGSLAAISDELRSYTATLPPGFQPATFSTPTVFGGSAPAVNHTLISGISYRGSDGLVDGDYFPSLAPQLRVGGLAGTEVIVRWVSSSVLPYLKDEDFPELTIFGIGARHNLSRYFPDMPVGVSLAASYNTLAFGDIIDLSSVSFAMQANRDFGYLGLYGGLSSDGGSMNLTYESTDPSSSGAVDTDVDASRELRLTIGAALNIPILRVFADATFGGVSTYSFGLRIGN